MQPWNIKRPYTHETLSIASTKMGTFGCIAYIYGGLWWAKIIQKTLEIPPPPPQQYSLGNDKYGRAPELLQLVILKVEVMMFWGACVVT